MAYRHKKKQDDPELKKFPFENILENIIRQLTKRNYINRFFSDHNDEFFERRVHFVRL